MSDNIILVPIDFTIKSQYALEHAIILLKKNKGRLVLLHITKKEKFIEEAHKKLIELCHKTKQDFDVMPENMVKYGDVYKVIGNTASAIGAKIIFMGNHQLSSLERIFGSYAIKVIATSKVPFITVTKAPRYKEGLKKIVLPANLTKEPPELLRLSSMLAKHFDSEILVIGSNSKKSGNNDYIKIIRKYFNENNIKFKVELCNYNDNFELETIKYAHKEGAGLIAISNLQENIFHLFGSFEQNIMANKYNIPVLVVNNNLFGINNK